MSASIPCKSTRTNGGLCTTRYPAQDLPRPATCGFQTESRTSVAITPFPRAHRSFTFTHSRPPPGALHTKARLAVWTYHYLPRASAVLRLSAVYPSSSKMDGVKDAKMVLVHIYLSPGSGGRSNRRRATSIDTSPSLFLLSLCTHRIVPGAGTVSCSTQRSQ